MTGTQSVNNQSVKNQTAEHRAVEIQAVVFRLSAEFFALPVSMVREVLDHREAFRIPGSPDWLNGLTDVRGQSVPVIDLRRRLGMPSIIADETTRIMVVEMPRGEHDGGALVLGLVVDKVLDVTDFSGSAIEKVPDFGGKWQARYIRSVMRRSDSFVLLLDIASILADADLSPLALGAAA
jgi:purine-binding chemotaxis protein CheW